MTETDVLEFFKTSAGRAAYLVAMAVIEAPDQFDAGCWCVRDLLNRRQILDRAFAVLRLPAEVRERAKLN
jgi:hypothetical protein